MRASNEMSIVQHRMSQGYVTPAQAGVHSMSFWIPACAGMIV